MTMSDIASRGYAHPEVLVSTAWLEAHLDDPNLVVVESNEDPLLYATGHVPGAFEVDWTRDLNDPIRRDYLDRERFQALMRRLGIDESKTVVIYGDKNNWWATYTLWVFQLFGLTNLKILDGGRAKWLREGRPLSKDRPQDRESGYVAPERDDRTLRAFRDQVAEAIQRGVQLVDVRSPQEFTGERLHMPDYPNEGAIRGGHIPTAKNIPWGKAIDPETNEFLPADQLRELYLDGAGFDPGRETIAYCRIGERSSHSWFVLKYLLGFGDVRNYDGSWTEWGNLVGAPVEVGA